MSNDERVASQKISGCFILTISSYQTFNFLYKHTCIFLENVIDQYGESRRLLSLLFYNFICGFFLTGGNVFFRDFC